MEYDIVRKTIVMEEALKRDLERYALREDRDFSGAMRYAAKIGLIALENPDLTIREIKDILEAKIDLDEGRTTGSPDFFRPETGKVRELSPIL